MRLLPIMSAITPTTSTTNAQLAAAIAAFILAEDELWASREPDGSLSWPKFVARETAFNRLKTIFETEFPHV